MKHETLFQCPKCSGYRYGSACGADGKVKSRICHGHTFVMRSGSLVIEPVSCHFTWPPEDDYKHFVKVGRFESKEEYDRLRRRA